MLGMKFHWHYRFVRFAEHENFKFLIIAFNERLFSNLSIPLSVSPSNPDPKIDLGFSFKTDYKQF